MKYLILETALKSDSDTELLKVLNSKDAVEVDKYNKRIKLVTTKNFIRPTKNYLESIIQSRAAIERDFADPVSELLKERLSKINDTVYAQFGYINTDSMYDKIWDDIRHEDLETPVVGWVPKNEKYRFEWDA